MRTAQICFVSLMVSGLTCCNNIPDCDDPNTAEFVVQFVDSLKTSPIVTIIDSLWVEENGVVLVDQDTVSQIGLTVNPLDSVTTFILKVQDEMDTFSIKYKQNQLFRSELCGPILRFSDVEILEHTFRDDTLLTDELLLDVVNYQVFR
ncbi:MAG: hypothetical protein RJQ09_04545 [Cyclobacteriaceae bacterium]